MAGRSLSEILDNETDRKHLSEIGLGVCALIGGLAGAVLVGSILPPDGLRRPSVWLSLLVAALGVFYVTIHGVNYWAYLQKLKRQEAQRLHDVQESARAARQPLRESVRAFAEMLETNYSWVLDMEPLEAQRRSLLWYDQIVSKWQQENEQWFGLRKSDEWDAVVAELGRYGSRMLEIWKRRRILFQYAVAYSTEPLRAREILSIERQIRQLQAQEAQAKREFEKQLQDGREGRRATRYLQ